MTIKTIMNIMSIRHLDMFSWLHIGVPPLSRKKVRLINNSAVSDHLLHCNYLYIFFDNLSILAHENKKFFLEFKKSLLIMRDQPSPNRSISSALLHLLEKVS